MRLKGALTAVTVGAGLLIWMLAPMASATTSPTRTANPASPVTGAAAASISYAPLCNLNGSLNIYGCATPEPGINLQPVELVPFGNIGATFGYVSSTQQIRQIFTNHCIEYNGGDKINPIRMDTCTSGRASQRWTKGLTTYQLENGYSHTCLEGAETQGFGYPLTLSPCSDHYNGENWGFVGISIG